MFYNAFAPFSLSVMPTNRCNFSCLHCFQANNLDNQPDLPLALYEKFLREARSYRTQHIVLTGGEPTLHPEFEALIALTVRCGYTYRLITNGWTFESIYPVLARYRDNLSMVVFSLDGAEAHTHDLIRQQPGSYHKVLQACMRCYYQQIPFQVNMTLHRGNIEQLEAVLDLAVKLGADAVDLGFAQLTRDLVAKNLAFSPEERKRLQPKILSLDETAPLPVYPSFDFFIENPCVPCNTMQMSSLTLDYKGSLPFCCQLPCDYTNPQEEHPIMVGSIAEASIWELHRQFIMKIADFQAEKVKRVAQQALTENEHFPCYYCAKYFHQLDWLHDFPDSPWNFTI